MNTVIGLWIIALAMALMFVGFDPHMDFKEGVKTVVGISNINFCRKLFYGRRCKMKEFVEKLIGRLEEMIVNLTFDESIKTKNYAYKNAIEIVNEVAEEYKSTEHINCSTDTSTEEVCEWKPIWINTRVKYSNCEFEIDDISIFKFKYCPYCGKKIKIIK